MRSKNVWKCRKDVLEKKLNYSLSSLSSVLGISPVSGKGKKSKRWGIKSGVWAKSVYDRLSLELIRITFSFGCKWALYGWVGIQRWTTCTEQFLVCLDRHFRQFSIISSWALSNCTHLGYCRWWVNINKLIRKRICIYLRYVIYVRHTGSNFLLKGPLKIVASQCHDAEWNIVF